MYYIKEEQLKQILIAIKQLPVRVDEFSTADAWVGLYVAVQQIANQPVEQLTKNDEDKVVED